MTMFLQSNKCNI